MLIIELAKHSEVVKQIISHNPELVIHVGDFALNGKCYDEWVPQFFSDKGPRQSKLIPTPLII